MPVMSCDCGKQLRVSDEHVGKRIRCPGCGATLLVKDTEEKAPAKKPAAKTPAGAIAFTCDCGKKMQAKAEHAGKTVKCPDCGASVKVPKSGAGEEDDEPAPRKAATTAARKPARKDDPDEDERPTRGRGQDEDDEDEDRPSKKAKKGKKGKKAGSAMPMILIGGGVAAILVVGGLIWAFSGGSTGGPGQGNANNTNVTNQGNIPAGGDLSLIPGDAVGFLSFRPADLIKSEVGQQILAALPTQATAQMKAVETQMGLALTDLERVTYVQRSLNDLSHFGGNVPPPRGPGQAPDLYVIFQLSKPLDKDKLFALGGAPTRQADHGGKSYTLQADGAFYIHEPTTLVVGPENGVKKAIDHVVQPVKTGALAALLSRVDKQHVCGGFVPTPAMLEMTKNIPANGPKQPKGLSAIGKLSQFFVTASVNGTALEVALTPTFNDAANAAEAKAGLDEAIGGFKGPAVKFMLGNFVKDDTILNAAAQLADNLQIAQNDTNVTVSSRVTIDVNGIKKSLAALQGSAADMVSSNNLKQIGLAFHAYGDVSGKLTPWAKFSAVPPKVPLHSWRVLILPYIEEDTLFKQIKLDEPWNSAHNRQFHNRMPKVYTIPNRPAAPGQTFYQGFVGPKAFFDPTGTDRTVGAITDGLSLTIGVIEASTSVNWMEPKDIDFVQPNNVTPQTVGAPGPRGFNVLYLDGSVGRLPINYPAQEFRKLITIAEGEPVNRP